MRLTLRPILLLTIIVLIAASFLTPQDEPAEAPDTLVYALAEQPLTLDPRRTTDDRAFPLLLNVFEGLLRFSPGQTTVEPALAEKYEVSADGLRWTFHLRENVRFHDGSRLNARSVQSLIEQQMSAEDKLYPYARYIFAPIKEVEVKDDLVLILHLHHPYAPLARNLAMPQAAIVKPGAEADRPLGTGPYRIAEVKDNQVILEFFAGYHSGPPQMERVVFRVITNPQERFQALKNGKVHLAERLRLQDTITAQELSTVELVSQDLSYLAFYTNQKPFDNPLLRQAVALAVDPNAIIRELYPGEVVPARIPLPPGILGYTSGTETKHDREEAAKLVADAGYEDTEITLITYEDTRPYNPAGGLPLADAIARQLEKIGLRVKVVSYDWEGCKQAIKRQEGNAYLFGWISDNADPDDFLYNLLHSSQIANGMNSTRYTNAHVDALLQSGRQSHDEERRKQIYAQALELIMKDCPLVCLNHSVRAVSHRPEIEGVVLQPTGGLYLNDIRKQ